MAHPFPELEAEYNELWLSLDITRAPEVDAAAQRLLRFKPRYKSVSEKTGVPIVVLATIHNRESDANFSTNLGQGDPLTAPSVHVPRGRPPLLPGMSFPVTWEYAAEDALGLDRLDKVTDWTIARALYEQEVYNGFGPRNHGIHTGYLWAGTNHYVKGKFVADNVWNPDAVDRQLGTAGIMRRMLDLDPSLLLPGAQSAPAPTPVALGGDDAQTRSLQEALNKSGADPQLAVDGSFGRLTRAALMAFQAAHALPPDGFATADTMATLRRLAV